MSLPIISADERLKETKGIKGCIVSVNKSAHTDNFQFRYPLFLHN